MRVEMSREFPVPVKLAYDYLTDPKAFPDWRFGVIEVIDPESASWSTPGDRVRMGYRILGRRVDTECTLDEVKAAELYRFTARTPGMPTVHESWHYLPKGEDAFELKVIQETEGATSFFGKAIDRTLLPRVVEKDLGRTLDNLEDIFSLGVPD